MEKNKIKLVNIIFVAVVGILIIISLLNVIFNSDEINYYENRTAYKIPNLNFNEIINGTFQDNMELAFSDQLPLSVFMKRGYNFITNISSLTLSNFVFKDNCENRYINLGNGAVSYGCNKDLVYYPNYLSAEKEIFDERIDNVNNLLSSYDNVDIYYIEKDNDIDFSTNKKEGLADYLKNNINTSNFYVFDINNFDEYKNYFYKTDHHWNYKGSYNAYVELVSNLIEDEPLQYKEEICISDKFSGSKAAYSGTRVFYSEDFCAYTFDFPEFEIFINGEKSDYGKEEYYNSKLGDDVSYANYYGYDDGEIIFDNHSPDKQNILVLGDSYDNAILKLLATHFNKTYSIDLRNYERENSKTFNYKEYIEENNIDRILIIGNVHYFGMREFNLED